MFMSIIGSAVAAVVGQFPALARVLGDVIVEREKVKQGEDVKGAELASRWIDSQDRQAAVRAQVQMSQGAWGPLGILSFLVGLGFVWHEWQVVLDSTPWHLVPTMKFYLIPWLEWQEHAVGTWRVPLMPGLFETTEHYILQALFYIGGGAAGAVMVAKAFRR